MRKHITWLTIFLGFQITCNGHEDAFALGFFCGAPLPVIGALYATKKIYMLNNSIYFTSNNSNQRTTTINPLESANLKKAFYQGMFIGSAFSTMVVYKTCAKSKYKNSTSTQ